MPGSPIQLSAVLLSSCIESVYQKLVMCILAIYVDESLSNMKISPCLDLARPPTADRVHLLPAHHIDWTDGGHKGTLPDIGKNTDTEFEASQVKVPSID